MAYDPKQHHRHSIRLKDYDYSSAGAYFITICVHRGQCSLGQVNDNEMNLSIFGTIVVDCWEGLSNHYPHVILDAFVVMPNHVHGVVILEDNSEGKGLNHDLDEKRAGYKPAPTKRHSLSEIIRGFKTFSAKRINEIKNTQGIPFWQRNYYEHIIRNERAYIAIRDYILNNPANWDKDQLHPGSPANQFNHYWK